MTFWRRCSATCGALKARERLSRASPAFAAASTTFLHSPDTMASMAIWTLFEMRFGLPGVTGGAGWSSAARSRLAGAGGVMFSMLAPSASGKLGATHLNVTFWQRARWPPHDSRKAAGARLICGLGWPGRSAPAHGASPAARRMGLLLLSALWLHVRWRTALGTGRRHTAATGGERAGRTLRGRLPFVFVRRASTPVDGLRCA